MKAKMKLPGTKRLKLKFDRLLSASAYNFNLRRYIMAAAAVDGGGGATRTGKSGAGRVGRVVIYAALDPAVPTFQAAKLLRDITAAGLA